MKQSCSLGAIALLASIHLQAQTPDEIDFTKHVKPLLEATCVSCHGPDKPKGDVRLDTLEWALKGGSLVPGKPSESTLYTLTILPADDDDIMPPKGDTMTREQTEVLRKWIEQGAKWPENEVLQTIPRVEFTKHIQPILEFNCVACHREDYDKGKLRLDTKEMAFGADGALVPFEPLKSSVYTTTILSADDDDLMPPKSKGGPLPKDVTDLLRAWIEQGAPWPDGLVLTPRKVETEVSEEDDLVREIHRRILATQAAQMQPYKVEMPGSEVTFEMVPIPGGTFVMGSPENEPGRNSDEGPQRTVEISPFWMGKHEVTWNEYEMFMFPLEEKKIRAVFGDHPEINQVSDATSRPTTPYVEMSFGMGKDGFPAISMTQHAANKYCQWISAKTGHFYRLPTEAEWEYACRAGTTTAFFFGDDPKLLDEYAWYADNSDYKYQKVGRKKPNPWGLHDMHGNVAEWVLDQYQPDGYARLENGVKNPWVRATTPYPHSVRGGSWDDDPEMLRSAARRGSNKSWKQQDPQLPKSIWYHTDAKFLGFRVVRPLEVPPPEELSKYWTSGVEWD